LLYRILGSYRFSYNTHTGHPVLKDWKEWKLQIQLFSCDPEWNQVIEYIGKILKKLSSYVPLLNDDIIMV